MGALQTARIISQDRQRGFVVFCGGSENNHLSNHMKTVSLLLSDTQAKLLRDTLNTAAQAAYGSLKDAEDHKAGTLTIKAHAIGWNEAEELLRVVGNSIDCAKSI